MTFTHILFIIMYRTHKYSLNSDKTFSYSIHVCVSFGLGPFHHPVEVMKQIFKSHTGPLLFMPPAYLPGTNFTHVYDEA